VGGDPHKKSATIEVVDEQRTVLATSRFDTTSGGYRLTLKYIGGQWRDRRWAVEGANGMGRPLAQRLLAQSETVLDVPAKLAARVRGSTPVTPARPTRPMRTRSRWSRWGAPTTAASWPSRRPPMEALRCLNRRRSGGSEAGWISAAPVDQHSALVTPAGPLRSLPGSLGAGRGWVYRRISPRRLGSEPSARVYSVSCS
jgi:hypothetical protein